MMKGFIHEQRSFNDRQEAFNTKQEAFNTKQEAFNTKQEVFNTKQVAINEIQKDFIREQRGQSKRILKMLTSFTAAFGKGFEAFSAMTLKVLEDNNGLTEKSLVRSKVFADPNGEINPGNYEFEVDLYCRSPLLVGECTVYVEEDELSKVEKFVKIVEKIHCLHGEKPLAYFFAFGVHEAIEANVTEVLKEAGVKFICPPNHPLKETQDKGKVSARKR